MTRAFRCDKCKEFKLRINEDVATVIGIDDSIKQILGLKDDAELCADCRTAFIQFMNGVPLINHKAEVPITRPRHTLEVRNEVRNTVVGLIMTVGEMTYRQICNDLYPSYTDAYTQDRFDNLVKSTIDSLLEDKVLCVTTPHKKYNRCYDLAERVAIKGNENDSETETIANSHTEVQTQLDVSTSKQTNKQTEGEKQTNKQTEERNRVLCTLLDNYLTASQICKAISPDDAKSVGKLVEDCLGELVSMEYVWFTTDHKEKSYGLTQLGRKRVDLLMGIDC